MEPSSQSDIVVGVEADDRLSLSDEIPPLRVNKDYQHWMVEEDPADDRLSLSDEIPPLRVIKDYQQNQDEENNKNGR